MNFLINNIPMKMYLNDLSVCKIYVKIGPVAEKERKLGPEE